MTYRILTSVRKEIATKMQEITGEKPSYSGLPRCAYISRGINVEKDGVVTTDEDADMELVRRLIDAGLIAESEDVQEDAEEAAEETAKEEAEASDENVEAEDEGSTQEDSDSNALRPTISFPLSSHTAESICNLVFTIYSKGSLISKSTGGRFEASETLVGELKSGQHIHKDEVLEIMKRAGNENLAGLSFDDEKVTFDGFPVTEDADTIKAWTVLAAYINKAAIKQNRVQARKSEEPNEKFAFRTWLTRIGMNGSELKGERNILYRNLSGHTAFRTPEDQERWTKRQAEKRQAARELNEAARRETAELANNEGAEE